MKIGFQYIKDPLRKKYLIKVFKDVKRLFGAKLVSFVIYGSVARGDDKPSSDTDILLIIDTDLCFFDRARALGKVLNKVKLLKFRSLLEDKGYNSFIEFYPLNIHEASTFRPIYLDMVNDAIIIYDKDLTFTKLIIKLRDKLKKLGSVKVKLQPGIWYWLLKPDVKFGEEVNLDLEP